jgi:parallel beta-helix repeat protein
MNIYVSPTGDDKNDGSSLSKALRTPQVAADRANPGDTVLFATGEYLATKGQGVIVVTRSGEAGKPIVFAPVPNHKPVFRSKGAWQAIKVQGASYLEFRGLTLRGATDDITLDEAMREMNNLNNPRTCGNGLNITDDKPRKAFPQHIIVRDCDVRDFPGGGINAMHCDWLTIENNVVARCGFWAPYANSNISIYQPVDLDGAAGYKIIIRNNVSFGSYNNVPFYYSNKNEPSKRRYTDGNGIILDDYSNSQGFGGGTGKPYGGRTLVANNVVFDNGGSGIHVYRSTGVDIVHNWAENNNKHPEIKDGQIYANSSKNVRILNNVLIAPAGKAVNSDYKNDASVVYDYNLYASADASSGSPKFFRALGKNLLQSPGLTLENWATGKRTFTATKNTPLRGAGTPFPEVEMDFLGKKRSKSKVDLGPFQL